MTHDERVLQLLSDRQPHSHHEVYGLHVIGHSRISSLRSKGYGIEQYRDGDDYMYLLVSTPEEATGSPCPVAPSGTEVTDAAAGRSAELAVPDYVEGQIDIWSALSGAGVEAA